MFTGGARETSFCASSIGWTHLFSSNNLFKMLFFALLKTPNIIRALLLATIELGLAIVDFFRGLIVGRSAS